MSGAHLWEVKHSYYCNDANFFSNDCFYKYGRWAEFYDDMGKADCDWNLLFRWDWDETNDDGVSTYTGDDYYRCGKLKLYWMQQRKGKFIVTETDVCRADEAAVIEFLKPRMAYLLGLWEPLK